MRKKLKSITAYLKMHKIFIIGLVFLLISSLGVYLCLNWDALFPPKANNDQMQIDAAAGSFDPINRTSAFADSNQIAIPVYETIEINADNQMNVMLGNPVGNPCYFRFTVRLETKEILYQSQLVPPGQEILTPALNKALPLGKHRASIQIETYTLDQQLPLNTAKLDTILWKK